MRRKIFIITVALCAALVCGCASTEVAPSESAASNPPARTSASAPSGEWTAAHVAIIEGFKVPESVCVDGETGFAYVSNIEGEKETWWGDDGQGFISRLTPDGKVEAMGWHDSRPGDLINSPKGLCIYKGDLYAADNTRLIRFTLSLGIPGQIIPVPGTARINDMATDGKAVWFTDTATGKIWRLDAGGFSEIKPLDSVNGITFGGGRMFGVSWNNHEVYELDPTGQAEPQPFGVAEHFTNPDGIEVLDDGSFLVSDFMGNKVCVIAPDRKTVKTLIAIETPADIGLDRARGLLYIPLFMPGKVAIFKLEKK
ncbi:MAG TPA: hypothetical protein PL033_10485 [Candidatus Brocadiia bacterium]|nr:hypothetical protein [Candidatus Brocadiia bacterium]